MNSILNLPLPTRCDTIARLVNECTNKELENFFPLLIDDLFGITNQVGWKLRQIKFNTNPAEFEILCKFLHPNGPVFKLCYKLLADCHLKYDFPLVYLPVKVQTMIAEGMVPSFYADKLQVDSKTRIPLGLALNPFELYMFHFVYHLVNPNIQTESDSTQWTQWDLLYIRLVEEYLSTFLPCNESTVQPPAHFFTVQSPPRPHNIHFPPSRPARSPTLLKQSVIMNQSPSAQHNSLHTSVQAVPTLELWRSELVAELCIDFWLSTSSYDSQLFGYSTKDHLPFWAQSQYEMKFNQNFTGPIWSQQYLPSGDHVRVVRFMVKHLHSFANSLIEDSSAMDELKRVIVPSCQGKLYRFIRYTIQHWPLDTSFRLVLETWLSYIQPWRYHLAFRKSKEIDDKSTGSVDPHWMRFVAENLLAYTLIFQQLLVRFSRIDLATPKNALMLHRVTKVFSLGNLIDYIKNVEVVLEEGSAKSVCSKWAGLVRQHIVDLEGSGFQYQPLFGPETRAEVIRFQRQIQHALVIAEGRLEVELHNQKGGFFSWLSMSSLTPEYSIDERKKVIANLTMSLNALKCIFQLEGVENVNNFSIDSSMISNSSMEQNMTRYDCRRSIRDIKYEGDPDLEPIKSFENAFLVRFLYHLSLWINTNYRNEIQHFYRRDDWVGGIMRQILSGPQMIHTYAASGPRGYSPRVSSALPPRISLRVWAHHRTIAILILSYFFFNFLGYPLLLVVILAVSTWFLFLFVRYSIGWAPKPPRCSSLNSSY